MKVAERGMNECMTAAIGQPIAFHPLEMGKWVVTRVITSIAGVETIKP